MALGRPRWPLDLVLDHASLQRVACNPKELSGLHDASRLLEGGLAQCALGFAKVQVFQKDRHDVSVCENSLVGKLFLVMSHTDTILTNAVCAGRWLSAPRSRGGRKRALWSEDAPISQWTGVSMRDTDLSSAVADPATDRMRGNEQS